MKYVFPVIHHLNESLTLEQAKIVNDSGANGLFLISHLGKDDDLPKLGRQIKEIYPNLKVGINFLRKGVIEAAKSAKEYNLDMIWGDYCGVSSKGLTKTGEELKNWVKENKEVEVFASVAFKYQEIEEDPKLAARLAKNCGFIPTTSGTATGISPDINKIKMMSQETGGLLGIASGMTCENIEIFKPHLSHILVATGVSLDDYRFDDIKLKKFIEVVKNGG